MARTLGKKLMVLFCIFWGSLSYAVYRYAGIDDEPHHLRISL